MAGEKAEVIATACTLASRLAALRRLNLGDVLLGSVERLGLAHAGNVLLRPRCYVADRLARQAEGAPRAAGEE